MCQHYWKCASKQNILLFFLNWVILIWRKHIFVLSLSYTHTHSCSLSHTHTLSLSLAPSFHHPTIENGMPAWKIMWISNAAFDILFPDCCASYLPALKLTNGHLPVSVASSGQCFRCAAEESNTDSSKLLSKYVCSFFSLVCTLQLQKLNCRYSKTKSI